jgi:hypothetical protein
MNTPMSLVNFYVPTHYKNRFDMLCRYHGSNRTSLLNTMIREYVVNEETRLTRDIDENKLNVALQKLVKRHSGNEQSRTQPTPKKPTQPRWEQSYIDDPFSNGTPW